MKRFLSNCHTFIRRQEGAALIEFVLVLPLFLMIVLGGAELTRYILINQKMDKAVYALGDVISQSTPTNAQGAIPRSSVVNTVNMLGSLMAPFNRANDRSAIITSLQRCPTQNAIVVRWQYAGGGNLSNGSTISVVNSATPASVSAAVWNTAAVIRNDVRQIMTGTANPAMMPNENMIIAEVFYSYRPFLAPVMQALFGFRIQARVFTRRAYLRPRVGDLLCLTPTFPCTDCTTPVN